VNTPLKLGAYSVGLALVFTSALGAGNAVGSFGDPAPARHDSEQEATTDDAHQAGERGADADDVTAGGLEISSDGYTFVPEATIFDATEEARFAFRIDGPNGEPLTDYELEHDKELHLIVVHRDLSGYQHVHPSRDANGTWTVELDLSPSGTYRVFADFTPVGADGLILGADLQVPGQQQVAALPAPSRTAKVDGYTVTLDGDLVAGQESELTLSIAKGGRGVADLQPYLAAYGHLVALRSGDLAYLHVHPEGAPGDGRTKAGPDVTFFAEVPSVGTYRLFLDFRHDGVVRTAEFTVEASDQADPPSSVSTGSTTTATARDEGDHDEEGH